MFEKNDKKYIITTDDYDYVFTLGEKNSDMEESTYKFNEIDNIENYRLKFFISYSDAKEFINFLLTVYPNIYKKYKFKIITYDNFQLILDTKKYNL